MKILIFLVFMVLQDVFAKTVQTQVPLEEKKALLKAYNMVIDKKQRKLMKYHKHWKRRGRGRRRRKHRRNRNKHKRDLNLFYCDDAECDNEHHKEVKKKNKDFLNLYAKGPEQFFGIHDLKDALSAGLGTSVFLYTHLKDQARKSTLKNRAKLYYERTDFEDLLLKDIKKENKLIHEVIYNLKELGDCLNETVIDINDNFNSKVQFQQQRRKELRYEAVKKARK